MPYGITYMWNLKYETNEPIYEIESETQRTGWWLPKRRGCEGGMEWKFGINRCKLLYRGWLSNKVLLCSTGKYIQYPVINHNGKEYEKNIYIYTNESLCYTAEIKHS